MQRVDLALETGHETNVLVSWRELERPRYRLHVLFGGYFRHFVSSLHPAAPDPRMHETGYRAERSLLAQSSEIPSFCYVNRIERQPY